MTTASRLDHVRNSFNEIERSTLPGPVKSVARFARRVARSLMYRTQAAFNPVMIKRNVIYPIRNILLRQKPLTVDVGSLSYLLAPEGAVPLEMWAGSCFERHELEFILSVLEPGMTFVDVGANVGMFAIPGAKKVKNGKVLAFEPTSWTYRRLIENARLNGTTNLETVHCALGDSPGEAVLQVNKVGRDGLNTIGRPTHAYSKVVTTERVLVARLDDALQEHGISRVDVIKIDTEGAELLVLRGAGNLLKAPDAPVILYEGGFLSRGFDYHPAESMWLLQKYGYSLFVLDSNSGRISVPPNGKAYDANVIAVKPSHPAYARVKERVS